MDLGRESGFNSRPRSRAVCRSLGSRDHSSSCGFVTRTAIRQLQVSRSQLAQRRRFARPPPVRAAFRSSWIHVPQDTARRRRIGKKGRPPPGGGGGGPPGGGSDDDGYESSTPSIPPPTRTPTPMPSPQEIHVSVNAGGKVYFQTINLNVRQHDMPVNINQVSQCSEVCNL